MHHLRKRKLAALALGIALLTGCSSSAGSLPANAPNRAPSAYDITVKYVVTFYPLWFTYQQWRVSSVNQFIGPNHMGPLYHAVVAPNDDTLYANTVVNVTKQPVILTIPATKDHYSVLSTDAFGDVNDTGIATAGTYGLTGPDWHGTLPPGVTAVSLPANMTGLIVRADKYAPDGQSEKLQAELFRRELRAAPLSDYGRDPHARPTNILPLFYFSVPFKGIADDLITKDPIGFLSQLQKAIASTIPPPLTSQEQAISAQFDASFNASNRNDSGFMQGARDAHQMILNCYLHNTGKTNWITFANIGTTWSPLVRSAITEFIQYGNSHATAAYYQTFKDGEGADLWEVPDSSSATLLVGHRLYSQFDHAGQKFGTQISRRELYPRPAKKPRRLDFYLHIATFSQGRTDGQLVAGTQRPVQPHAKSLWSRRQGGGEHLRAASCRAAAIVSSVTSRTFQTFFISSAYS